MEELLVGWMEGEGHGRREMESSLRETEETLRRQSRVGTMLTSVESRSLLVESIVAAQNVYASNGLNGDSRHHTSW